MSSTQPQHQEGSQRPLRVLSLSGGGVRSLFTLKILKWIVDDAEVTIKKGRLEPWQMFDMIGGTETGGLIAIMLGRLRMSIDDCIDTFKELCKKIYLPKDPADKRRLPHQDYNPNKFDSKVLAEAVKEMIRNKSIAGEENPFEDPDPKCKVFIALTSDGAAGMTIMSSYSQPRPSNLVPYGTCKLWEACAATTASVGFFDPVQIRQTTDGNAKKPYCPSIQLNNPVNLVGHELNEQWPGKQAILVNIGSGFPSRQILHRRVDKTLKDIAPLVKEFKFNFDTATKDFFKEELHRSDVIEAQALAYMSTPAFENDYNPFTNEFLRTFFGE